MRKILALLIIILLASTAWAANTPTSVYGFPKPAKSDFGDAWITDYNNMIDAADALLSAQIGALGAGGVPWYNVVVTTTNTLDAILAATPAAGTSILVGSSANLAARTLHASNNRTLPAGVNLVVLAGYPFVVPTGRTFTINGTIEAGPYKIATCEGTGAVTITQGDRYFRWFGATGDGSTDDSGALTKTFATRHNSYNGKYLGYPGDNYKISSQVNLAFGATGQTLIDLQGSTITVDVSTLGTTKVTNGTFDADTDWTKGAGWTISGGTANHTAGSTEALSQDISALRGECYLLTVTMSSRTAGSVYAEVGSTTGPVVMSANQAYTYVVTAKDTGHLKFWPTTDFDGKLDAVAAQLTATGLYVDGLTHSANNFIKICNGQINGSNTSSPRGIGVWAYRSLGLMFENVRFSYLGVGVLLDGNDWNTFTRCWAHSCYKSIMAITSDVGNSNGIFIKDLANVNNWDDALDINNVADFSASWINLENTCKGVGKFTGGRDIDFKHITIEGAGWDNVTNYMLTFNGTTNISVANSRLFPEPKNTADGYGGMTYSVINGGYLTSLFRFENKCTNINLVNNAYGNSGVSGRVNYLYSHDDTTAPINLDLPIMGNLTGYTSGTFIHLLKNIWASISTTPGNQTTTGAMAKQSAADGDLAGQPNYWWSIIPGSDAPFSGTNWNNATIAWDTTHGRAVSGSYKVGWTGASGDAGLARRLMYPGDGTWYGVMTFYVASDTAQIPTFVWINGTASAKVNLPANKNKWHKVTLLDTLTFPGSVDAYGLEILGNVSSGYLWVADTEVRWFVTKAEALQYMASHDRFTRQIYGTELVTNGDTGASAGWTYTDWNFTNPYFTHNTGNTTALIPTTPAIVAGKIYDCIIYFGGTAGSITVTCGGDTSGAQAPVAAYRSYMFRFRASTTGALTITPSTDFDGGVHYCYMREVTQ